MICVPHIKQIKVWITIKPDGKLLHNIVILLILLFLFGIALLSAQTLKVNAGTTSSKKEFMSFMRKPTNFQLKFHKNANISD